MRGGGRIINISSIGGRIAMPHMAAYCTSKFALGGLSETLRSELKSEGIVVTTVYPGFIRTGSPVQAVFKGDHAREFAWFALGDSAPGISISADTAARRILDGCCQGRAEVMVSIPAKAATLARALFPELFAWGMELAARALPHGRSQEAWTGARSLKFIEGMGEGIMTRFWGRFWGHYISQASHKNANRWNERLKYDADFNLGITPTR
jgi:NAD(P)-dependent dehydrogenase (short-subunit alcohol dehydrogenase family)